MTQFAESLKRLFKAKQITAIKLMELLKTKKISEAEYTEIIKGGGK